MAPRAAAAAAEELQITLRLALVRAMGAWLSLSAKPLPPLPPLVCNSSAAARATLGSGCRCGRAPPASSEIAPRYGLPTEPCPLSVGLQRYAARHPKLLAEGRVLIHCSRSGAVGNYVRSVPAAVLLAILLDRALVLRCDRPLRDGGRPVRTDRTLAAFFRGPHFDPWREIKANASSLVLHKGVLGDAFDAGAALDRVAAVRLSTNTDAEPSAILANPRAARAAAARLGELARRPERLMGCLLRLVLAPTPRLERLERALPNVAPLSAYGLRRAVVAHVRLGDSSFFAKNASAAQRKRWRWVDDTQGLAYRRDPLRAMRCLARASGSEGGSGCLGCAVLSDSAFAEACAVALLDAPTITPGVAVHPQASATAVASSRAAVEKLALDWWLLARSHAALLFSGGSPRTSSFAATALQFRDASAPPAAVATVELSDDTLDERAWLARCELPKGVRDAVRAVTANFTAIAEVVNKWRAAGTLRPVQNS